MSRRLPTLLPLVLAAAVGLFALTAVVTAQPPQPATPPGESTDPNRIKEQQEENLKKYKLFAVQLRELERKWAASPDPEDKKRADTIKAALDLAGVHGVENLFKDVVGALGQTKSPTDTKFQELLRKDAKLTAALKDVLRVLKTEDEATRLKKDIADLKEIIRRLNELKQDQENLRARTEAPRADQERLAKEQAELAQRAQELANKIAKNNDKDNANQDTKPNDGANKPDDKSQPKSEPKPGEKAGEEKADAGDPKSSGKETPKDDPKAGENAGEQKPGPPMDMAGDPAASKESPKDGDPKAGEGKPMGEPKAGEPKSGDPKSGDPKSGDPKSGDPKSGEPKSGDPKSGDPKSGDPKAGTPKSGDPKAGTPKSGDPKAGDPKSGDPKAQQNQQKPSPAESKAQGENKAEAKPSEGQQAGDAKPQPGQKPSEQSASAKPSPNSPSSPSSPSPPTPKNPNAEQDPAQQAVQDAVPQQKGAEKDLKKNDRPAAAEKEDRAIEQFKKALEELEKRLAQLREKERKKQLAGLEERLLRMLSAQKDVLTETVRINGGTGPTKKERSVADFQNAGTQADKERGIIVIAESALRLIEGDGSAIVFYEVLNEVRKDMDFVAGELDAARVGDETQLVEKQIIDQLQRMLEAVKQAQKELDNKDGKKKNKNDKNPTPPDQSLIKKVEQLKLIKELQIQVNERTVVFGKSVDGAEQSNDPAMQKKLRLLGDKQKALQEMLHKMVTER